MLIYHAVPRCLGLWVQWGRASPPLSACAKREPVCRHEETLAQGPCFEVELFRGIAAACELKPVGRKHGEHVWGGDEPAHELGHHVRAVARSHADGELGFGTAGEGADLVQKVGVGQQNEALAGLEAAQHEVGVVVIDEVPLIHEADSVEDRAPVEDAACGCVLDRGGLGELAGVDGALFQMAAVVAEEWLELSAGGPDGGGPVEVVHDGRGDLAPMSGQAVVELLEEVRTKDDVVVQEQNRFAAGLERSMDAGVVARGDTLVLRVCEDGDEGGVCAALGDGVIRGGVVDGPDMEVLECLAAEGADEIRQHHRAVVQHRHDADLQAKLPCGEEDIRERFMSGRVAVVRGPVRSGVPMQKASLLHFDQGLGVTVAGGGGAFCPLEEVGEALLKMNLRCVAEDGMALGEVGEAVADVSFAKGAADADGGAATEEAVDVLRDLPDRGGLAGADVERVAGRAGQIDAVGGGAYHIADVDEVTAFLAVFKDVDGFANAGEIGEDGEDAGVRIAERLARAEDVLVAQGKGGDAEHGAEEHGHLLLHLLGEAIEGGWLEGCSFRGGNRGARAGAERAKGVEHAEFFVGAAAGLGIDGAMLWAGIGALAVDGAGRGDHDAFDPHPGLLREQVVQVSGAGKVDLLVAGDLVHGLTGAGLRGEVDDGLVAGERLLPRVAVAYVAVNDFEMTFEVGRDILSAAMNLGAEVIKDGNGVATSQEFPGQVGADKAGTTADQNLHWHRPFVFVQRLRLA